MSDRMRELEASAERMAALANQALSLMSSAVQTAQEVSALLAADVLDLAAMLPAEQQASIAGAVARARQILGSGPRH